MNETSATFLSMMLEECELTIDQFATIINKPASFVLAMLDGSAIIDKQLARLLAITIGPAHQPGFWTTKCE